MFTGHMESLWLWYPTCRCNIWYFRIQPLKNFLSFKSSLLISLICGFKVPPIKDKYASPQNDFGFGHEICFARCESIRSSTNKGWICACALFMLCVPVMWEKTLLGLWLLFILRCREKHMRIRLTWAHSEKLSPAGTHLRQSHWCKSI